ncbi:MAG: AAA family ATPase [Prevotella sp.]|nr:AAA family ATPase [Prevotella sp.]
MINEQAFQEVNATVTRDALTQEELQKAQELQTVLDRLEKRRITPSKELPKMEFLFRLFHKPCFPRGELVAVSGKAKSGKTFVSSILMSLCFRSQVLSVERIEPKKLHVLWYDTEQSEESTQDILRHRIIPLTGTSEDQFPMQMMDVFNVRPDGYDLRLPMLEAAVRHYEPDLVILDGIRDLVADINDGVVAQDCIERLMHLASEVRCCIVCILHQNKSSEDRNLRGWIGTELKNKAFEVYECAKSSERIFTWRQTDTRKYDILDALKFAVNDDGIPYLCSEEQLKEALFQAQRKVVDERQRDGKTTLAPFNPIYVLGKENHKTIFDVPKLFTACMQPGQEYSEDELQLKVGAESNIATERVYREQLSKAVTLGIVMQSKSALNGKNIYMLRVAEVKASGPIQTSLFEREGRMGAS